MDGKKQIRGFSGASNRHRGPHKPVSLNPHSQLQTSALPSPTSDELAASIQASVAEVSVMWILHSFAGRRRAESLDQQIKNFSTTALAAIAAHNPILRDAKQEHLWMIYFKSLLAADTHPREQMIKAIKTVGVRSWIQESAGPTIEADVKPAPGDLSDLDTLEHISQALAAG